MQDHIYSVSELTKTIKETLESSFPRLWVEGEISNFKRHSSGHLYFTLKDNNSQIRCVMWRFRAASLLFLPEDGLKVVVEGELQVYEAGGTYQLILYQLQPTGVGDLQLAFEQLKKKLLAEGLFDQSRKKKLPPFPERIGVITSPTGAAIRDIISVITRRYPPAEIFVYPVRVQGEGAKEEIVQAIKDFNEFGKVDVIVLGRGGGSLEDLWAFNEEMVARAIFASGIPIISAVGHEIDFTIADFVADKRAPTPSAASEMVVPEKRELHGILVNYLEKFTRAIQQKLHNYQIKIENFQRSYAFRRPGDMVYQKILRLDELTKNIQMLIQHRIYLQKQKLQLINKQLLALGPNSILQRGYSICYKDKEVVKHVNQLKPLDMVRVKLSRGDFTSQVKSVGESE
jgi:exodeoxyribonuclease VII large subunit